MCVCLCVQIYVVIIIINTSPMQNEFIIFISVCCDFFPLPLPEMYQTLPCLQRNAKKQTDLSRGTSTLPCPHCLQARSIHPNPGWNRLFHISVRHLRPHGDSGVGLSVKMTGSRFTHSDAWQMFSFNFWCLQQWKQKLIQEKSQIKPVSTAFKMKKWEK